MINLLLSNTKRSIEYLKAINKKNLKINKLVIYVKKKKLFTKKYFNKKFINIISIINTNNVNDPAVDNAFNVKKTDINIVSTYAGEIVSNKNLLSKKLLHCHAGNLPEFKGSTTIYYSLILKKNIYVSLFEMNNKIDSGKVLFKKKFSKPKKMINIEKNFDNEIRAKTLIDYLLNKKVVRNIKFAKSKKNYLDYYIAHPIIRQIVLNKKILKNFFSA